MLHLDTGDPTLARFVRDLEAESPLAAPGEQLVPDLALGTEADLEVAQLAWANRVVDEYQSVVVFSDLLAILSAAAAPFATLCAVQRLIGDELRHARLCARMVAGLGGWEAFDLDLVAERARPRGEPREHPVARALEVVALNLWIGEAESLPVIRAYRDAASDPASKRALEILHRDEVRHAATGRALFDALDQAFANEPIQRVRAGLAGRMEAERRRLGGLYRASAIGGPGRVFGASLLPEDLPTER